MAMAAAIHAVQLPDQAFQVPAGSLLDELARRERDRVNHQGFRHLDRLVALALLHPEGLDARRVVALGELETIPGLRGQALLDKVRTTTWWQQEASGARIARLEPDLPATAFLRQVLLEDPDPALPARIAVATEGSGQAFEGILSRLGYDLSRLSGDASAALALEQAVIRMLDEAPERVQQFDGVGFEKGTTFSAGFSAKVLGLRLRGASDEPTRALLLNNLASFLSDLGWLEAALDAAQEAVSLYRQLAATRPKAFIPYLATSLNNLASFLSHLGRQEAALDAAQEAVSLYRQLAAALPEAFISDLATSLHNLAIILSAFGRREAALDAAQEAVSLYRQLAATRPKAFIPYLATSLNNLASFLSHLGRQEAALDAAQEAISLRRQLAAALPEAFIPDLATSLHNLANFLSALGRREAALDAAQEAVSLYRQLPATQLEAAIPNLAKALGAFGRVLHSCGREADAHHAFREGMVRLTPLFLKLPLAHARLISGLKRDYLQASAALGAPPDWLLLQPVAEMLEHLDTEHDAQ